MTCRWWARTFPKAAQVIGQFREGLLADIRAKLAEAGDPIGLVKEAIWNVLGKPGLDILVDADGTKLTSAEEVSIECLGDTLEFDLHLAKGIALADTTADPVGFDIGIPGFGLTVNADVKADRICGRVGEGDPLGQMQVELQGVAQAFDRNFLCARELVPSASTRMSSPGLPSTFQMASLTKPIGSPASASLARISARRPSRNCPITWAALESFVPTSGRSRFRTWESSPSWIAPRMASKPSRRMGELVTRCTD